ncbi:hypothetical protein GO988_08620 [Hymenobacter sp. HMF4947]|uniref:Glycosyltransferase RgtA/B/C/D-like domain-containing protein n=1 Tax=Hymenobacter ginkgonis TaxID=2682976 RepID=A0A7K1TDA3_9BACT|nr:hypothetical protein [Hymenobacter ginkgonis]MVN76386.1 hypothetical protein [Hymenobacter ginkgonis]
MPSPPTLPPWLLPRRPYHAAAFGLFAVVAAVLYGPYLHTLPEGIHVWPQADRLALAINFFDGGFHFWYPRTSGFSPGPFSSIGGVTGVEFPIQAYLAGLSGLLFGRENILPVFRTLDAVMAVVGFWYLFRIVFERTGNFAAGLLPGAFLLASPTFIAYAGSTLPDPFSLSLTFVGYYYWLRYFEPNGRFADLPVALVVLSLAALIKTTCGLHLLAVFGITVLYNFFEPTRFTTRQRLVLLGVLGAGLGAVLVFYLHNQWLNETYRAEQFLATAMPVVPVVTWHTFIMRFFDTWRFEYFSRTDYRLLIASALLCLVLARRSWQRFRPLVLLVLATLAIGYVFYGLMGPQINIHDYYIICSFMPPVLLVLVLALLLLSTMSWRAAWPRHVLTLSLLLTSGYLAYSSIEKLAGRMSDDHPPASRGYTHRWMRGGAATLKQAGVPQQARLLVLGDWAPNTALVYFDRRGITWLAYLPELTVAELERHMSADSLQYVVMPGESYAQLAPQKDALLEAFTPVLVQSVAVLRRRHPERLAW